GSAPSPQEEREGPAAAGGVGTGLSLIGQRSAGCSSRIGDCAEEVNLPMHPCACFEASRLTLTQSSWTTPSQGCSRQWMSGYAAVALAAPRDRGPQLNFNLTALGE